MPNDDFKDAAERIRQADEARREEKFVKTGDEHVVLSDLGKDENDDHPGMLLKEVEITDKDGVVHRGHRWIKIDRGEQEHEREDPGVAAQESSPAKQVALVMAYDAAGRLLLGRRHDTGAWTLPGGHVEPGEVPEDAARRELKEEAGLDAFSLSPLHGVRQPAGEGRPVLHVFTCLVGMHAAPHGHLDPDREAAEWRFVPCADGLPGEVWDNLQGPPGQDNVIRQVLTRQVEDEDEEDEPGDAEKAEAEAVVPMSPDEARQRAQHPEAARLASLPHEEFRAEASKGLSLPMYRGHAGGPDPGPGWYATRGATAAGYAKGPAGIVHHRVVTMRNPAVVGSVDMINATQGTVDRLRAAGHDGMVTQWSGGLPIKANPHPERELWALAFDHQDPADVKAEACPLDKAERVFVGGDCYAAYGFPTEDEAKAFQKRYRDKHEDEWKGTGVSALQGKRVMVRAWDWGNQQKAHRLAVRMGGEVGDLSREDVEAYLEGLGKAEDEDLVKADTPEFQQWFEGSHVKDRYGAPLRVYHGTSKDKDFHTFKIGQRGAWFTTDPNEANSYAETNDSQGHTYDTQLRSYVPKNVTPRVIPAYLSLKNPYHMTLEDHQAMNVEGYRHPQGTFFNALRAKGHDGVILPDGKTFVAFHPHQIKSVFNARPTATSGHLSRSEVEDLEKARNPWNLEAIHQKDGEGNVWRTIIEARSPKNEKLGEARFLHLPGGQIRSQWVEVGLKHRRQGIASSMYRHAEQVTGKTAVPNTHEQTPAGQKLWGNRNRVFGKAEDLAKAELLHHHDPRERVLAAATQPLSFRDVLRAALDENPDVRAAALARPEVSAHHLRLLCVARHLRDGTPPGHVLADYLTHPAARPDHAASALGAAEARGDHAAELVAKEHLTRYGK